MEETTTSTLSGLSLRELLDRLASRDPIPGGGSAAALSGAMAAALVSMVAELTIGRPDAAERDGELREVRDGAQLHRTELLALAEQDADAYDSVVAARRMPRATDVETAARAAAIRDATLAATRAPLRTAERAAEVLELAARIAPIGNRNAASDAGVAAQLASAAVRGAILNVSINLPYLAEDEPLRASAPPRLAELQRRAVELEGETVAVVERRIQPS